MFAQSSTSSPFGAPRPSSNPYGTPQSSAPFAQQQQQQQQQPSYFGASQTGGQQTFSGPQFGGGNHGYGQGSPAAGGFGGSQFGAGGGGGYGSPYGTGQQSAMGGAGAGVGGTPGQAKRNYLPGYLSGGAAAQQESSSPQPMGEERSWDSPAGKRTSISGSPVTRFGGGSLFGGATGTPSKSPKFTPYTAPPRATAYRAEPEEDAPPVASLNEFESHDQSGLHAESAFNPLRRSPSGDPSSASPFSSSIGLPQTSSSSSEGYAVNIFGFPPSALDLVLDYFSQFGEVVSKTPSPEGGNWITISYAQPWSAARAARKNGEILGGVLMVGVKAVDEDSLKRALAGAEGDNGVHASGSGAGTPVPRPPPTAVSTPSGVGKPVNVLGPQSAFKAQPTPTRKGFLGLGGGAAPGTPTSGAGGGGDAQASLFAERSKAAVLAQQEGQQPKSTLGRVSEAIFGW